MDVLKKIIAPKQRPYIYSHPLALWFAIGITLVGLVSIFLPHLVDQTSVSLTLPEWLRLVFNAMFSAGGFLSAFGILRGKRSFEAAGMTLLSSTLLVYYIAIINIRPASGVSGIFILALAIGCFFRAKHLTKTGYDTAFLPISKEVK